jgi:hypothetical protein
MMTSRAAQTAHNMGVLGGVLLVGNAERYNSMPLPAAHSQRLLEILQAMAAMYEATGLPPKLFYFNFDRLQLLVILTRRSLLAVSMATDARVVEIEVAARKLAATAHLKSPPDLTNPLVASLAEGAPELPAPPEAISTAASPAEPPSQPPTMTWTEATHTLETIVTKVLSQAIASKLISSSVQKRGLDPSGPCHAATLAAIAGDILQKIPNRSIRASIEKEVQSLVNSIL